MRKFKGVNKTLYLTFIHIYAAHVDNNFTAEEAEYIQNKFGSEAMNQMLQCYKHNNRSESDEFISDNIDILKEDDIDDLKMSLDILYHVNGNYCRHKKAFSKFLNKLLKFVEA